MNEAWKPVRGFEGFYSISSLGNMRSEPRTIVHRNGITQRLKGRILKRIYNKGYPMSNLHMEGKSVIKYYHVAVCEAFQDPPPDGKPWVLHWDDDPENCRKENLRWGNADENSKDARRNGVQSHSRKTLCPQGHKLGGKNVTPGEASRNSRRCRSCDQERSQAKREGRPFSLELSNIRFQKLTGGLINE